MAKMPKRRKSKDNPYILDYIEEKNIYIVSFRDSLNEFHKIEVSEKVFNAFDKFELEDISQMHKSDKHIDDRTIDNSEYMDLMLYKHIDNTEKSVEQIVEEKLQNEDLYKAIKQLPEIQKRRIKKYYFDEKNLQDIANEEKCSVVAVKYSIDIGISKIKEILKK